MRYKRWCFGMLGLIAAVMLFIAGMNYFVDPFGYFTFQSGDYADVDFKVDDSVYQRVLKAEHVLHFGDQYDAFIVGGSKTGSYRPETLSRLDGYRYYNMFELGGTLGEYEATVKFLLEHTSPKKIVLNISGGEVRRLVYRQDVAIYRLPAVMTGKSQIAEYADYLLKDVTISLEQFWDELRNGKKTNFYNCPDGERYLAPYYKKRDAHPKKFTKQAVLKNFDEHMETLFTTNVEREYYQNCLDSLKNIKDMCDSAGVELLVILAPAFIGEMSEHDTTYYWDYLRNMATITDYWDFSGYHDIDLNPYNFYNEGHFYYEVVDLMVDTMLGEDSYEGFGTYVTKYNVAQQLQKRSEDYNRLKQEYLKTGTIALQDRGDASWIH